MDRKFTLSDFNHEDAELFFLNLGPFLRQKYVIDLIRAIEDHWENRALRESLFALFKACLRHLTEREFSSDVPERIKKRMPILPVSLQEFLTHALPLERDGAFPIREEDYLISKKDKPVESLHPRQRKISLIADNIRSAANLGSLFRSSECFGIGHIFLCGYTATPEKNRISRSAMGTEKMLSWSWHQRTEDVIKNLRQRSVPVIALETCPESHNVFGFRAPDSFGILVGNERHGISQECLKLCDQVLHIPLHGRKNSLNVGVAFGIAAAVLTGPGV